MPTFKSKMVNFMIRNNHHLRGKISKEVFDMNTSIDGFRERCEKGANRFAKVPADVSVEEVSIDGMKAEWLVPEKADREQAILYVHGGGYVSGSCNDHRSIVTSFAKLWFLQVKHSPVQECFSYFLRFVRIMDYQTVILQLYEPGSIGFQFLDNNELEDSGI